MRRLLLLPAALALAVAGCDASAPADPGLQTSPTVPTADIRYIAGVPLLHIECAAEYTYETDELLDAQAYWAITSGSTYASITSSTLTEAVVRAGSAVGAVTLAYKSGSGVTLATYPIQVKSNGGECPIPPDN